MPHKTESMSDDFNIAIDDLIRIERSISNMKNIRENKTIFVGRVGSMKNELILNLIKLKLSQDSLYKMKDKYIEYISENDNYGIMVDDKFEIFESVDLLDQYIQSNHSTFSSHIKIFYPRSQNEILKDIIVMDTPFYDYSDERDDEIVSNCRDGNIFIVVINAVGSIGYKDKNLLKRISENNFIKLIFIFTCMDQVSKENYHRKKIYHETNAIRISNEILIPPQDNIPILFVENCRMNEDQLISNIQVYGLTEREKSEINKKIEYQLNSINKEIKKRLEKQKNIANQSCFVIILGKEKVSFDINDVDKNNIRKVLLECLNHYRTQIRNNIYDDIEQDKININSILMYYNNIYHLISDDKTKKWIQFSTENIDSNYGEMVNLNNSFDDIKWINDSIMSQHTFTNNGAKELNINTSIISDNSNQMQDIQNLFNMVLQPIETKQSIIDLNEMNADIIKTLKIHSDYLISRNNFTDITNHCKEIIDYWNNIRTNCKSIDSNKNIELVQSYEQLIQFVKINKDDNVTEDLNAFLILFELSIIFANIEVQNNINCKSRRKILGCYLWDCSKTNYSNDYIEIIKYLLQNIDYCKCFGIPFDNENEFDISVPNNTDENYALLRDNYLFP